MQRVNTPHKETSLTQIEYQHLDELNEQCLERTTDFLKANMDFMFTRIDDLLSSAIRFAPDSEQLQYSTYLNILRQIRNPIVTDFINIFVNQYYEALTLNSLSANSLASTSSLLEKILNMDEEEIETSIVITHLTAKYQNQYSEEIDELLHNFDELFTGVATNPIDPVFICSSFHSAIKNIGASMCHDLRLYHHFEEFILKELQQLYIEINAVVSDYIL